uniref:Chemokine interleukin-8-like domain-containing protein n=1 Tax=Marmota marmota marmota TaxID=9994 RepID=A0A8C6EWQ6_MARMA
MKVLVVALFVLLCTSTLCAEARNRPPAALPTSPERSPANIPRKLVVFYYETSSTCSSPSIVFVTKKGRHVCAHPNEAWVQEYIRDLE